MGQIPSSLKSASFSPNLQSSCRARRRALDELGLWIVGPRLVRGSTPDRAGQDVDVQLRALHCARRLASVQAPCERAHSVRSRRQAASVFPPPVSLESLLFSFPDKTCSVLLVGPGPTFLIVTAGRGVILPSSPRANTLASASSTGPSSSRTCASSVRKMFCPGRKRITQTHPES